MAKQRNTRANLWLATAVVLGSSVWLAWHFTRQPTAPSPAPPPAQGPSQRADSTAELQPRERPAPERTAVDATPVPAADAPAAPTAPAAARVAERALADLTVRVVDADGLAATGAELLLTSRAGNTPPGFDVVDALGIERSEVCDVEGLFHFTELPLGRYRIRARARGARAKKSFTLSGAREVLLTLAPPSPLDDFTVLVRDGNGAPVAGASVEVVGGVAETHVAGVDAPALTGTSDAGGQVVFEGARVTGCVAFARAQDGRCGKAALWTRGQVERALRAHGGLVVTLAESGGLMGRLVGLPDGHAGEARVRAWSLNNTHPYHTNFGKSEEVAVVDGVYRFEGLATGNYALTLEDSLGLRVVHPQLKWGRTELANSVRAEEVLVVTGKTVTHDLEVTLGGVLEGSVRSTEGKPLAGALVRTTYAPSTSDFPDGFVRHGANVWRLDSDSRVAGDHPISHRRVHTGAAGSYRLTSLPPGRHRVEVIAAGLSFDRREEVRVADGETTTLEHELARAGTIEGLEPGGGYLGVAPAGEQRPVHLAILSRGGSFRFPGLAPGAYEIARYHSDTTIERVPLVTVQVEAGRTTWVDLREAERPIHYAGRLLDPFGPLAGVTVEASYRHRLVTDEQGRFEFSTTFPWTRQVDLTVVRGPVRTRVELPGVPEGETSWTQDVFLDDEELTVHTHNADGRASTATIWLDDRGTETRHVKNVETGKLTVDASGERLIPHLMPGKYQVQATFPNGMVVDGATRVPRDGPLVLEAPPSADLTITATDSAGAPVENASVSVATWTAAGPAPDDLFAANTGVAWRAAKTDSAGRAKMRGVRAGDVAVRVTRRTGFMVSTPPATRRIRLEPGSAEHLSVVLEE
ncbi:MAG: carboxypeptidase regulatory-like domain-containing protein [bacterium]|nr:carboxypeptidase regulatory-like domain-containing protein [bacterium]